MVAPRKSKPRGRGVRALAVTASIAVVALASFAYVKETSAGTRGVVIALPEEIAGKVTVKIDVLEAEKRPVNAVADNTEVKSVTSVRIAESAGLSARILSDPDHSWSDRILAEQFDY